MTPREHEQAIVALVRAWLRARTRPEIARLETRLRQAVAEYEWTLEEQEQE